MVVQGVVPAPTEVWDRFGTAWALTPQQRQGMRSVSAGMSRWSRYPVRGSGIGRDHAGFEVSVRHEPSGRSLRFIIDPLAYVDRHEEAVAIVSAHLRRWAPRSVAASAQGVVARQARLFPAHSGTFFAWLGAGVSASGAAHGKVYLNPWLSLSGAGLRGAEDIVSAFGARGLPMRRIKELFDVVGPMVPHIVGVNLGSGTAAPKIYFCGPNASRRRLVVLARAWDLPGLERVLASPDLANAGEVHVCLPCPGDRTTPAAPGSVSLSVPSWFRSPEAALTTVAGLVGEPAARSWDLAVTPSFLGLGRESVTVYARTGPGP